jgi:excinuclease ABC subunit A
MSCREAVELFANVPNIRRILQTLCDVGLDYLTLGQSAPTLSGGEAQRVKLAAELSRPDTGQTLYLLDEPTTGRHFDDLAKLLDVLQRLVDQGNTVVVIEHNLDVIKSADWIIDIGPEAGERGGEVVAAGTPEVLAADACSVSHTARALVPVLASSPYRARVPFDRARQIEHGGDLDLAAIGRDVKMPWEVDGRRWHTSDRVDRNGRPCRWDGRILDQIERRIHQGGEFAPTNWNSRTVVEINAQKKSDGWFFHAITGERWLVKLKFRTAKKTFKRDALLAQLTLPPLDDVPEIEAYGRAPRIKCKNLRGPWQEVQIDAYTWQEIDTPAFWSFLDSAIAGFQQYTHRVEQRPEDVMPWKVLGQKWHLARKGFPPGKKVIWDTEVLEDLLELLAEAEPHAEFLWNNQNVVNVMVPSGRSPWATVFTKRLAGIDLVLNGPKGAFALGRIADLGAERGLSTNGSDTDRMKLRFVTSEDLARGDLALLLREHAAAVRKTLT